MQNELVGHSESLTVHEFDQFLFYNTRREVPLNVVPYSHFPTRDIPGRLGGYFRWMISKNAQSKRSRICYNELTWQKV